MTLIGQKRALYSARKLRTHGKRLAGSYRRALLLKNLFY